MSTHNIFLHKNIGKVILRSTHNIYFYGELTKIIFELSSNTLFIFSTVVGRKQGNMK